MFAGLNNPELRLGPLDTSRVESGVREVRSDLRELGGIASQVDLGRIGGVDDMRRRVSTSVSQVERDIRGLDGIVTRVRLGRLDTSGVERSLDSLSARIGSGGSIGAGGAQRGRVGTGVSPGEGALTGIGIGLAGGAPGAIAGGIIGALSGLSFGLFQSATAAADASEEFTAIANKSHLSIRSLYNLSTAATVAGSEDGLDGVADSAYELNLRLSESREKGDDFIKTLNELGLSYTDLKRASPESAFYAVLDALIRLEDKKKAHLFADQLFGGSSEHITGLIGLQREEFDKEKIDENADAFVDAHSAAEDSVYCLYRIKEELGRAWKRD